MQAPSDQRLWDDNVLKSLRVEADKAYEMSLVATDLPDRLFGRCLNWILTFAVKTGCRPLHHVEDILLANFEFAKHGSAFDDAFAVAGHIYLDLIGQHGGPDL